MGMLSSVNVFQLKVYDLIGAIQGVRTYINDILCIDKGIFAEHINQLEEIFRRFKKAGLKSNASKYSFGLKEIPYLGYIISIDEIKPNPEKVQGIINLTKLKTAKDMKSLIDMIQF